MQNCRQPGCGWQAEDDWAACPNCGRQVGRIPLTPRQYCDHEFVVTGPHCIKCGGTFDDSEQPTWVGVLAAMGGLACVLAVGALIRFGGSAGMTRLGFTLLLPALALLGYALKLLIPSSK